MNEIHIETRIDSERGCGWRKPGGKYLVGGELCRPCGKLPMPLERCPCCDEGIKPSRGWTWIGAAALIGVGHCSGSFGCETIPPKCPLFEPPELAGLLWIGEKFYDCPEAFIQETYQHGISRRISQIPHGFRVGETLVLLAHRKVLFGSAREGKPGIFGAFIPRAIEYVVHGQETPAELERLVKQGCTLVKVERRHPDDTRAESARPVTKLAESAHLWPADGARAVDGAGDGGPGAESVPQVPAGPGERTVGPGGPDGAAAGGLAV